MYASNEDEFYRDNDDNEWVFLRQTPPATTIVDAVEAVRKSERSNSTSSSSSSSSSSSQSDCSEPASSLSSMECENALNNEQENPIPVEDPVLASQNMDEHNATFSTGENKEENFPSERLIKQNNENETTPIINEYDLPNNGLDSSHEMVEQSNTLRQRTGADVSEVVEENPIRFEEIRSPSMIHFPTREPVTQSSFNRVWIILLIFALVITTQRSTISALKSDLMNTNQRLAEMEAVSMENVEQKLSKQLEEKFHKLHQQQLNEFDQRKLSFISQINELHHLLHMTKQNLTDTIHQLSMDNQQLYEQVIALEHRLQTTGEHHSRKKEGCPEGSDCANSPVASLDALLAHLIKQTASIAEDTSGNLSNLFEQLSATLSGLVDRPHEFVEESKRKLNDLAGSQTAEQVQTTILRGVENLSSSFRKVQSSYSTWLRTRAQQREQARKERETEEKDEEEEEKPIRRPWRWTFQRGQEREQMRHQPSPTKTHPGKKPHHCHSKCQFPVNHICTMKHWLERLFHP